MKVWPTLYGETSAGKIKEWDILVEDLDIPQIVVVHGQQHGKKQTSIEKVKEGKNIGKSNETTPYEQACLQAESQWKKKQDKGYRISIELLETKDSDKPPLPMLALKYEDAKHRLVWPVLVQPKLNGRRCLARREGDTVRFYSRGNKEFKTLKHIIPDFLGFMEDREIRDGEIYNHGGISFQKLISYIKDEKNPEWEMIEKYVQFHNYDVVSDKGFKTRRLMLKDHGKYIKCVPTYICHDESEVSAYHAMFIENGYEGTMVRSGGDEPYELEYRSHTLLKKKDFIDDEFKIIGCKEGVGKDEGKAIFRCQTKNNTGGTYGDGSFDVRCKGVDEIRQEQWKNREKYIGKMLSVKFQCYSDEGIPIFPVGIVVRDYE